MQFNCQTCGETSDVKSLLAASREPCPYCGQLLMGPLERGTRTVLPAAYGAPLPECQPPGMSCPGLGAIVGMIAGIGLVVAVAQAGSAIPVSTRGAILGGLTGALLSPVLAISGFISMLIFPISLEGLLGDSLWNRLAKALNHRTVRPLFLPVLFYVVCPMALCAFGGTRVRNPDTLTPAAGLGAALLGAAIGCICGCFVRVSGRRSKSADQIDQALGSGKQESGKQDRTSQVFIKF